MHFTLAPAVLSIFSRRWIMDHEDRALAKLLRAMRCFGLAPYRSLQSSQISRPFAFYSRLLFFCFGGMIIWALMVNLRRRSNELVTSKAIVLYLITSSITVSITGILYLGMFHSTRRIERTFHLWKHVKEISQSIGCLPAADSAQLQVCLLLIVLQVALIALVLINSWILSRSYNENIIKTLLAVFTINCGYLISNKIILHLVLVVMKISLPFQAINEQLVEIATEMQSNDERFDTTNLKVPMVKINPTVDMLKNFNVVNPGKKMVHERVRSLARAYVSICGLVQQHSDSEEMLLLFMLIYILMNVANSGYILVAYGYFIKESNFPSIGLEIAWYIVHIFRGILLAAPWHKIDVEVERTRNLICKLMCNVQNIQDPVLTELEVFHIHLTANHPSYTVLGMFTMKRPMILTMMALTTTGLAVFL